MSLNELDLINLRLDATRDYPGTLGKFAEGAQTTALEKVRGYAEKWPQMYREGLGLLLYGDVGTGKSHAAGCLADFLLDRGIPVRMTDAVGLVSRLQADFGAARESYLHWLLEGDLLILDDLGAQRSTPFARECVLDLINRRMAIGKPMAITTNLSLKAMQEAADLDERRIYDRVRQVCVPIRFSGESFRKGLAAENLKKAAQILGS